MQNTAGIEGDTDPQIISGAEEDIESQSIPGTEEDTDSEETIEYFVTHIHADGTSTTETGTAAEGSRQVINPSPGENEKYAAVSLISGQPTVTIDDSTGEAVIEANAMFSPVQLKYYYQNGASEAGSSATPAWFGMLLDASGSMSFTFDEPEPIMVDESYPVNQPLSDEQIGEILDKKNTDRIKQLNRTIEFETGALSDIEREIKNKENEAVNFDSLLKSIEQSKEASKLLIAVNRRIETLSQKRSQMQARIDENYTINLLDDMWILMGFADIAEEYSNKVSEVDKKRRKLEQNYLFTAGQEKAIKKMQTDFVPLPVHIPGQKVMQEMLDEEVCKICGRPAKKHSEAWEFMLHRLEEYMESLNVPEDEEIAPFYMNNYIVELQKRDTTLNDNLSEITRLRHKIQEAIAFNNRMHDEVKKIDANLNVEFEQKKRILAQTDGLTEEQLLANYENISNWVEQKNKAENRIDFLKRQRAQHRAALDEAQDALSKLAEGTSAAIYAKTAQIIRQISDAFKSAKETNKKRLLHAIEDESNEFLEKLNSNDFKGTIRIIEKANGQGEAVLMNNDNTRIFTPNTALRTTYLMSVLFAIGKLSSEKDKTEFPLLFDAPTSSFTDVKESEFFNVISKLKKQVIIVTKSFLKEKNGEAVLDQAKVEEVNGSVFRIEKKKPFDDKKLGTIQTVISKIK